MKIKLSDLSSLFNRNLLLAGFAVIGVLVGLVGWSGDFSTLPLILVFPLAYGFTRTRGQAFALSAAYVLSLSRGLPKGTATFFGEGFETGIMLWIVGGLTFIFLYTVLWSRERHRKAIGFFGAMILLAVPPFGVAGWGSPLTVAGALFPSLGFLGLGLTLVLIIGLVFESKLRSLFIASAFVLTACGSLLPLSDTPSEWLSTETNQSYKDGVSSKTAFDYYLTADKIARSTDRNFIVFSEGGLGWRSASSESFWTNMAELRDKTLIVGFEERVGTSSNNSIAVISPQDGFQPVYNQRMPVPVSMWKPFSEDGTNAYWFDNPIVSVGDKKAAMLICYEQLLVWPIVQSAVHKPDIVIGIANDWWAAETSIPAIQKVKMQAWARLFGLELVTGFNL